MRVNVRALCLSFAVAAVASGLTGCKPKEGKPAAGEKSAATRGSAASTEPCGVLPSPETVHSGAYKPLSRPLFLHINTKALARPEVAAFLKFYLNEGQPLVESNKFIPLLPKVIDESKQALAAALEKTPAPKSGDKLSGSIEIDGSSTVFPITQAVAVQFRKAHPDVQIKVGMQGTGGGFKKFVAGNSDINDSSRTISKEEVELCKKNQIDWIELKIAVDGLTVVVNPENDWCKCLTVEQLKDLWKPRSKVKLWSDLNPAWPEKEIKLYGPGSDSGTFDYFTEVIVGKSSSGKGGQSRTDYTASENDNTLAIGVRENRYSLGYFGYSYYASNEGTLKAVGIVPAAKKKE